MSIQRLRASVVGLLLLAAWGLLATRPAVAQFPHIDKVIRVAEAQREWTPQEEKAIGEATAAKLIAIFGLYEEPRAVKYVNLVGEAVAQFAPRQGMDYHFGILDTEIVNAFACPGGYVFVTRGLLANVEDEAELAGVLGHEVIHTGERHLEKELRNRKMAAIGVEAGAEHIPVSELANLAERTTNFLLAGKLSRDKENEADIKGLEIAAAVGYDTRAFPEFLALLDQASQDTANRRFVGNLTASHPKFSDRIKRLNDLIGQRGWDQQDRPRLAERYHASLVFGPAPAEAPAAAGTPAATEAPAPAAPQPAATPGPTPSTSPGAGAGKPTGGGGGPTAFPFRPFSADQITTQGREHHKVKMYAVEQAFRMEGEEQGQKSIVIMRLDRKVMWSLMPDQQMYAEIPLNWGQSFSQAAQDPSAKVEREELGTEQVGPYHCVKYRVRVTYQGQVYSGIQWSAPELDGFVVKMYDEKSKTTTEYQNIRLGPPDPSLFEIPPGYQKINFPGGR